MNATRKLIIVSFALISLPFITIGVQSYYQNLFGTVVYGKRFKAEKLVAQLLPRAVATGDFSDFESLPARTGLLVKTDSGKVLFQNENATDIIPGASCPYDYVILRFRTETVSGRAYLAVEGNMIDIPNSFFSPLRFIFLFVLLLVVGFPIMILGRLGAGICKLERATVKIASGNLDFPSKDLMTPDFSSLGRAMDRMRTQLKDDRERRDRFIMGVSHDLKTPLSVIQGYVDALIEGVADSEGKKAEYYEIIKSRSDLLGERITHLVELAKSTSAQWRNTLTVQDFNCFLENVSDGLSDFCEIEGFVFAKKNALPSPCPVFFDRDMVSRVFENLVANALAYGSPKTTIILSARMIPGESHIEIGVENEGPGVSPESMEKIFEPFFRGDKSRNDGGFGLGLASVKSIVDAHGWSITVQSVPRGKTMFLISIPARYSDSP